MALGHRNNTIYLHTIQKPIVATEWYGITYMMNVRNTWELTRVQVVPLDHEGRVKKERYSLFAYHAEKYLGTYRMI